MRKGGLALIAILLLGSLTRVFFPQSESSPTARESGSSVIPASAASGKQGNDQNTGKTPGDWYPTLLREKIRDFFGEEAGPPWDPYERKAEGGKAGPVDIDGVCESINYWCVPPSHQTNGQQQDKIQFVIAAVPDPVHSHLGLFFDRSIDSIQQGATSRGFLFDRAIMPWEYFDLPASQLTGDEKFLRKVRESYPGLMIFRKVTNVKTQNPLFVFVVGETPTAGINKEQFQTAVKIMHEMREGKDTSGPGFSPDFSVLGPSFSGSLYSLRVILEQYLQHYWKGREGKAPILPVYAVVLATGAIQDFQQNAPAAVRMTTFMEDATVQCDKLLAYTDRLKYSRSDVALLNEDDTAYGNPESASRGQQDTGTPPENRCAGPLLLSFPRGISQFRSAYSKDLQNQDQSTDSNQPQRRTLRLDLEVTGSDDDNVAPYVKAQTAMSQEAIMLSIASELRRHDIKFILIRATDPLDELFLSRYLASEYPDARLVVPTPDLLFARDEGGLIDGTLGLNTYPVSPTELNPLCRSDEAVNQMLAFPAASSVGLYNATVALLGRLPDPTGVSRAAAAQTGATDRLSDTSNRCQLSPNLWLTVVSRNSFHPVRVLRPAGHSSLFPAGGEGPEERSQRSQRIPAPWIALCVLCLALLGNHGWSVWKSETLGYWHTVSQPGNTGGPTGRDLILWVGALTLVGIAVVFISCLVPFSGDWYSSDTFLIAAGLCIVLAGFVAFLTFHSGVCTHQCVSAATFFVASAVVVCLGIAYAYASAGEMVLWQQRMLDLASYVSAASPILLLLAAVYGWFWFSLKSESLVDWRSPRLPEPDELPETFGGLTECVAHSIRECMRSFGGPGWVFKGAGVILLLLAAAGIMKGAGRIPIRSLEGPRFDWTYSILLGFALFLLLVTLLRSVAVWLRLQRLLNYLDRPGMRQALDTLKGFEWSVIWNPFDSMQVEARRLYWKEAYVVERLQQSLGELGDAASSELRELKGALNKTNETWKEIIKNLWKNNCQDRSKSGENAKPRQNETPKMWKKICALLCREEHGEIAGLLIDLQKQLAQAAGMLCKDFLNKSWTELPADNGEEAPQPKEQSTGTTIVAATITEGRDALATRRVDAEITKREETQPNGLSVKSAKLAEELAACVYSTFITIVLLRIRWLVFTAVLLYTAIVFSSVSYPFQPKPSLRTLSLFLFLAGGAVIGYVYEEMHRDPTLRRMTSTDPNKIDTAFWVKLVSAGLLPLLGLLTTLFPQVGHFLYTVAAPILQATK